MIKEINHLTFGVTVSGKNVNQRIFFFITNSAVWSRRWPHAKKWHHIISTSTHGGKQNFSEIAMIKKAQLPDVS